MAQYPIVFYCLFDERNLYISLFVLRPAPSPLAAIFLCCASPFDASETAGNDFLPSCKAIHYNIRNENNNRIYGLRFEGERG